MRRQWWVGQLTCLAALASLASCGTWSAVWQGAIVPPMTVNDPTVVFRSLSATADDDIWINGSPAHVHWDGVTWRAFPDAPWPVRPYRVFAGGPARRWSVGALESVVYAPIP